MANEVKGLQAILALKKEREERAAEQDTPKADWFKWPTGVTKAKVRFLQEFDEGAKGYDAKNGLALVLTEHQAPGANGYKRRALCTLDSEGECYACQQHDLRIPEDDGNWRQRINVYIQAFVDYGNGEKPKPVVISRTFGSGFVTNLIDDAVEEETVTDVNYRVSKEGSGKQTQWVPKRDKGEPFDVTGVEVFEPASYVRNVPYDKQAAYYGAVYTRGQESAGNDDAPAAPADEDW